MEVTPKPSVVRHTLDTVRVLHDTILTLQQALKAPREQTQPEAMDDTNDLDETGDEGDDEDVFEESDKRESDEDIDDIELVFTTAETEPTTINDHLVPIRDCSTRTMLVETDISKCGVVDELEPDLMRRNTLPAPAPYRPLGHRELMGTARVRGTPRPVKPVPKAESSAQTDITAVPGQWKSETYLAHKISYNLTTLPSKFTLPVPRPSQVPLNDKTREARRVLLSDINFTSMVPELSRSADHLQNEQDDTCHQLCKNYPQAFEYMKSFDGAGREGGNPRCCDLTRNGSRSSWGSYYGSRCQASTSSITQTTSACPCYAPRRRHSWRPPPSTYCCHHPGIPWSSVPSSPTRCSARISMLDITHRRVNVRSCNPHLHPGQSLPDLRDMDGDGDSTDSLVDEAEEFLRHQIDALLISKKHGRSSKRTRRMSADSSFAGFHPPKSAQPFLPRAPKDLKPGYLVKVISTEGRVVVGKMRYSGKVSGRSEPYVGVELPHPSGVSDGTFLGFRYFQSEEDHAIFVPFNKVVIAWST